MASPSNAAERQRRHRQRPRRRSIFPPPIFLRGRAAPSSTTTPSPCSTATATSARPSGGNDGLFDCDTRYLSHLELLINGAQPLLLGSAIKDDNLNYYVDLTNPDIYNDDQISSSRTRSTSRGPSICSTARCASASCSPIMAPSPLSSRCRSLSPAISPTSSRCGASAASVGAGPGASRLGGGAVAVLHGAGWRWCGRHR